jgi:hypothetical protein
MLSKNSENELAEREGFGLDTLSPVNALQAFDADRTDESFKTIPWRFVSGTRLSAVGARY